MKGKTSGTLRPDRVSTRLRRIAELSRRLRGKVLTTLAHSIDLAWLYEAYGRTRKSGAPGVDRQTSGEYASELDANLRSLLDRFHSGRYRAPPVRRVEISKGDGGSRPIGIPTFEDKVLQRAVAMVLEAVYEEEFLDCSYGFRPGRSAHQALQALRTGLMDMRGGWVLDLDITKFFDTLDHGKLREILDGRVRDGVLRRQIDKWLKAGVMSEGVTTRPVLGTPQGGVISPLLANIYLHEVLDRWFEEEVRPRLRGRGLMIRYADDVVMAFSSRHDAERVLAVLPKRLGRYGLALHPDKTQTVRFERPPRRASRRPGDPGTFDFLGLTHYWGRSRRGNWVVKRKTSAARLRRSIKTTTEWLRRNRHWRVPAQHAMLCRVLLGHYRYYGVTANHASLCRFAHRVTLAWCKWLRRRSQRTRLTKERFFKEFLKRHPLPEPRCYASVYRQTPRAANLLFGRAG